MAGGPLSSLRAPSPNSGSRDLHPLRSSKVPLFPPERKRDGSSRGACQCLAQQHGSVCLVGGWTRPSAISSSGHTKSSVRVDGAPQSLTIITSLRCTHFRDILFQVVWRLKKMSLHWFALSSIFKLSFATVRAGKIFFIPNES